MLTEAMAGGKRQKKQAKLAGATTPKRTQRPEKPIIGSSSTWNDDQLDLFKVTVAGDVDVKRMIPEKWFDYGTLENYQSSASSLFIQLTLVAHDNLVSVELADLSDDNALFKKSQRLYGAFKTLRKLLKLKVTDSRKENLSEKRHEKHVQQVSEMPPRTSEFGTSRVGPSAPPQSEKETQRVASISDPEKSSAGSKYFYACREQASQDLGNQFCELVISSLFSKEPSLDWVTNRPQCPVLAWRNE